MAPLSSLSLSLEHQIAQELYFPATLPGIDTPKLIEILEHAAAHSGITPVHFVNFYSPRLPIMASAALRYGIAQESRFFGPNKDIDLGYIFPKNYDANSKEWQYHKGSFALNDWFFCKTDARKRFTTSLEAHGFNPTQHLLNWDLRIFEPATLASLSPKEAELKYE